MSKVNKTNSKKNDNVDEDILVDVDDVVDDVVDDDNKLDDESKLDEHKLDDDDEDEDEDDDDDDDDDEIKILPKRNTTNDGFYESAEIKIVPDNERMTSEYMTLYEYSMIIGTRATHIADGSVLYTEPNGLYDPRDIAKKEIYENKCPLSISRKIGLNKVEIWSVNDMIKPNI